MTILSFLPIIIAASGLFLLVKLRFFFILSPIKTFRALKDAIRRPRALTSLFLSLAGTLGVGNIVGVAFGISIGGPGSVFWLLLSSVFSLILKFSEATLASDMKLSKESGMIEVIEKSFKPRLKILAPIYAILCVLLSLSMGSALQTRAAVESFGDKSFYGTFTVIFTFLVAIAVFGGAKRIEKITSYLIPIATVTYIFLSVWVIAVNASRLPAVFSAIFKDAFSPEAAVGGSFGFVIIDKMREGFSRGLLSNEAGAGTSAFAHSRNEDSSPVSVGLVGMCEVFFDTVVLCMLTAIAVLVSVPNPENYSSGIEIIKEAVKPLGGISRPALAISVFAFAYSTVICWFYYGRCALSYLSQTAVRIFPFLFIFAVFFGGRTPSSFLIYISDYLLFFLSLISLLTVIKNSDRLVFLSEKSGLITKGGFLRERKKDG